MKDAIFLRDNYIDGIQLEQKEGELKFKVQKNWTHKVNLTIDFAIITGVLENIYIIREYHDFLEHMKTTQIHDRHTSREDIEKGNTLLNSLIGYCEAVLEK